MTYPPNGLWLIASKCPYCPRTLFRYKGAGVYVCAGCGNEVMIVAGDEPIPEPEIPPGDEPMAKNWITNPMFAPPYAPQDGVGELQLAQGWRCGYVEDKTRKPNIRRPEYRRAEGWDQAQQFFGTQMLLDGWVMQRVNVGTANKGKIAVLTVTCALESKDPAGRKGDFFVSVGIDRWGHEDVRRKTITWLTPQYQDSAPKWTTFTVQAEIENDWITAYIQASNNWEISGSLFIKFASLEIVEPGVTPIPEPEPEPTPVTGECAFSDTKILAAITTAKTELLAAINAPWIMAKE